MPRPYKALQKQGYKHYFTALTGRTRIAIIHSKTSFVGYCGRGVPRPNNDMDTMRTALAGEACLAPTKPCGGKAIEAILLPLQGAHELRLFIPKHHLSVIACEACLAPTKPCGGKAIDVILLPLQGAHELRLFIPKHHCRLLRARRVAPYGWGSIPACQGAPLQPQCYLKIRQRRI